MYTLRRISSCEIQGSDVVLVQVQDLHVVSPRSFLEVAGGIVHGLSCQQARNNTSKVGQVRETQFLILQIAET